MSLYTKLGFDPKEPLSCVRGPPIAKTIPGYAVRTANERDVAACNRVCLRVHGHTREGELRDAVMMGSARSRDPLLSRHPGNWKATLTAPALPRPLQVANASAYRSSGN